MSGRDPLLVLLEQVARDCFELAAAAAARSADGTSTERWDAVMEAGDRYVASIEPARWELGATLTFAGHGGAKGAMGEPDYPALLDKLEQVGLIRRGPISSGEEA